MCLFMFFSLPVCTLTFLCLFALSSLPGFVCMCVLVYISGICVFFCFPYSVVRCLSLLLINNSSIFQNLDRFACICIINLLFSFIHSLIFSCSFIYTLTNISATSIELAPGNTTISQGIICVAQDTRTDTVLLIPTPLRPSEHLHISLFTSHFHHSYNISQSPLCLL